MTDPVAGTAGSSRGLLWGLVATSALALLAFGLMIGSRQRAREATLGRVLARQALLEADTAPATGLLLALEAVRHKESGPALEAESALRSILPRIYRSETILGPEGTRQIAAGAEVARPRLAILDATGAVFVVNQLRMAETRRVAGPASSAVALSRDGLRLATAGVDGVVRLWETEDPGGEAAASIRHPGAVTRLALDPEGRWLAAGGEQATRLYPLDGEDPAAESLEVPRPDATDLAALAFSADGRWLAAAPRATRPEGRQWPVQLWDVSRLPELAAEPAELYQAGEAAALVFSPLPGTDLLATAHRDGRVLLWRRDGNRPSGGSWSGEVLRDSWFRISTLTFDPTGSWLATASDHGRWPTVLWEVEPRTGRFGSNRRVVQTDGPVTALAFSPDGLKLAAGGLRRAPGFWNLIGPAAAPIALPHASRVSGLGFSGDGRWLATAGRGAAQLWDLLDRSAAQPVPLAESLRIAALAAGPGSQLLALSDRAGAVEVVSLLEGAVEPVYRVEQAEGVRMLALSPGGRWLATAVGDEAALLWDLADERAEGRAVLAAPQRAAEGEEEVGFPAALSFDPRGRWLAQIHSDGSVALGRLPDTGRGSGSGRPLARSTREITYAFSGDGRWLATGAVGGNAVRLWALEDESPRATTHATPPGLLALAFEGKGDLLKLATMGGGTRALVSVLSQDALAPTLTASLDHPTGLQDAALSPDGRWLVTVSGDLAARLIDSSRLGGDGEVVRLPHAAGIQALEFSPDGRWLATTSLDRVVRLWALDLDELIEIGCRSLEAERRGFSRGEWEWIFPPALHSEGLFPLLRYRSSYARICPGA